MKLSFQHLNLPLRHTFTLGNGSSRTHTPITLVQLHYQDHIGYGEAAMPPYLAENHETATVFFQKINTSLFQYPFDFEQIHAYLDHLSSGNTAAKAAVDIALHDLWGKITQQPLWQLLGSKQADLKPTACTIGISEPNELTKKIKEAEAFSFLKIKLGSVNDNALVAAIRKTTDKLLYADVNQGWKDREYALDMSYYLKEQGILLLEQPFEKNNLADLAWLKAKSPIPIIADESCQRLSDIEKMVDCVDGINIKLMKSTGIYEALQLFNKAKKLGLKTLIGCMTETSCATYAALSIAPLADYVDIDGPWMLAEQPFSTPVLKNGICQYSDKPGLGLSLID